MIGTKAFSLLGQIGSQIFDQSRNQTKSHFSVFFGNRVQNCHWRSLSVPNSGKYPVEFLRGERQVDDFDQPLTRKKRTRSPLPFQTMIASSPRRSQQRQGRRDSLIAV